LTTRFDELTARLGFFSVGIQSKVADSVIGAFEDQLGHKLPEDYREFLQAYGMTAATGLNFPSGGGVEVFFGLQEEGEYNLQSEWEGMRERIPPHLLPIADSPGGLICLSLVPSEKGAIYWWASEDCRSRDQELAYIASSFTDFLNSLSLDEEE
jgi:hypothetical protein